MTEIWKPLPNFPDYSISNFGRLKRLTDEKGTWAGKILKPRMNGRKTGNYFQYRIPNADGKYINLSIARLVALTFIPNPDNKPEVNHIDGDKKNNKFTNLEWSTHQENIDHACKSGLILKGSRNKKSVLKERDVPLIRQMRSRGRTLQSIGDKFGVSYLCIRDVVIGRTWKHV